MLAVESETTDGGKVRGHCEIQGIGAPARMQTDGAGRT